MWQESFIDELMKLGTLGGPGFARLSKRLQDKTLKEKYLKDMIEKSREAGPEAHSAWLKSVEEASKQEHIKARWLRRFGTKSTEWL